jgi:hypothetical protein
MTHVWLVKDPVSTFATCAPFPAFAAENIFRYETYNVDVQVDLPCSDSAPTDQVNGSTGAGEQAP